MMILTSASQLNYTPKKIISLVPSQTELLYALGLEEETIGITKFCIHPNQWYRNKIRVGGTKTIDIQIITSLQPDLIIANKEENMKEQVEELAKSFNVWLTDVNNFEDSCKMIKDIGLITNKIEESSFIISQIKFQFQSIQFWAEIPAAYLIWKNPYMTIGGDTFINDMLLKAGFKNVFAMQKRYPQVSVEQIKNSGTKVLLLSSEPFPFKQKHIDELQDELPGTIIKLVDGELFSWYGSRLLHSPAYFIKLRTEIEELLHIK
ncbi:MAG: cobalamin-binding protein [Sphingobacteriales bacterium]|nr:MAG: cobalamin-binding protein [Sphingobacteriales bacterium]